jgi:hypothetical protein
MAATTRSAHAPKSLPELRSATTRFGIDTIILQDSVLVAIVDDLIVSGWKYANSTPLPTPLPTSLPDVPSGSTRTVGSSSTLTGPTMIQYDVDIDVGGRILVANSVIQDANGIYNRTKKGSRYAFPVFTKSTSSSELQKGSIFAVLSGTLANTIWVQTQTHCRIGTGITKKFRTLTQFGEIFEASLHRSEIPQKYNL